MWTTVLLLLILRLAAYLLRRPRTMTAVPPNRFVDASYQITGDLIEVPHLDPRAVRSLAGHGITSTYQLVAYFLDSGRDEQVFAQFLQSCDAPAGHSAAIARAIATRVAAVGIKLEVALPANIVQSSRITDDQMAAFLARTFTGSIEHDFQKMGMGSPGKPSASVANLAAAGITTTDMLFAALLKKFDGPIDASSADKAAEFYNELKDKAVYGVATGYSATIVEAIKAQLDIGIDTTARARLAAIGEEPASPPGTDQRPRGRTRGVPAPVPDGIPLPAPTRSSGGVACEALLVLMVALGMGAYYAHTYFSTPSTAVVVYEDLY